MVNKKEETSPPPGYNGKLTKMMAGQATCSDGMAPNFTGEAKMNKGWLNIQYPWFEQNTTDLLIF